MNQRIAVVGSAEAVAERLGHWVTGSYVGIGAVMFGLYWLMDHFVPGWVALGIRPLNYLLVPVAIFLCALFLLAVVGCLVALHDISIQAAYSALAAYYLVPLIRAHGWLGAQQMSRYLAYVAVFLVVFGTLFYLMKKRRLRHLAQILGALAAIYFLYPYFMHTFRHLLRVAGWS